MADPVIQIVNNWVRSNIDHISRAYWQKGGWEGWAQVSLALYLEDHAPSSLPNVLLTTDGTQANPIQIAHVLREVDVYEGSAQRADIIVPRLQPAECIIIELKCESMHNPVGFRQGLFEDVEKVRTSAISRFKKPAVVYVVGISVSAGGIMSVQESSQLSGIMQGNADEPICSAMYPNCDFIGAVVWWWKQRSA
jgi:hypothetical protein